MSCPWTQQANLPATDGHSLLLSSYLRIKRKENSSCSACGHLLQDLTHLIFDCPASELLGALSSALLFPFLTSGRDLGGVARLLGLRGVPSRPHPSEGVGQQQRHHHQLAGLSSHLPFDSKRQAGKLWITTFSVFWSDSTRKSNSGQLSVKRELA